MTTPQFYPLYDPSSPSARAAVLTDLSHGLLAPQASVSPKYLYDALGSRLFDAITELAEYYPTRTESAIFERHLVSMAQVIPRGAALVDLGAGSCEKAERLFEAIAPKHYIPIDISVDYLRRSLHCLQRQYPQMLMSGVGMDFSSDLALPPELMAQVAHLPIVVFYPGSSIGNFAPAQARALLKRVQALAGKGAHGGGLLIGVDLVKPQDVLVPAYDDTLGVTAAFNQNMLLHINRLIGSDFRPRDWQHVALFNTQLSRIEMHLQARHDLNIQWPGHARAFKQGERIHTENSYKWSLHGFAELLRDANFAAAVHWTDDRSWFSVHWANAL